MGFMDILFGQGSPTGQPVNRLSPAEFKTAWEMEKNGVILDVRRPDEFMAGHIQKAVNLDFMSPSFNQQLADLDKDKSYYLYCASGNRSGQAAAAMAGAGFSKIANIGGFYGVTMIGIILLWNAVKNRAVNLSNKILIGGFLFGWAIFNLVEGIIDHHLLVLHNIREVSSSPSSWNFGFLGGSVVMLLIGWMLIKNGRKSAFAI